MADDTFLVEAAERLKTLVRQGGTIEASQIGVLGLDDVKRAAGPLWSSIGGRIREGSRERIARLLGPGDAVLPAGDGYLVIYASRPGRDLAAENARIQQALNAFYLGEEATKAVRAEARLHKFDAAHLEALTRPARAQTTSAPTPTPTPATRPAAPIVAEEPAPPQDFACMPVWSAKNEAVVVYWMMPMRGTAKRPLLGYSEAWFEQPGRTDDDYLEIDLAMLRAALVGAEDCLRRQQRCMVGFSVHATTMLTSKRRAHFITELHKTPQSLRPYLIARIAEMPPGTPLTRVGEWVNQIKPIAARVSLQVHETDRNIAALDDTGAAGVCITLALKQNAPAGRLFYQRQIPIWMTALQHRRIGLQLDNVNDPHLLKAALAQDVDAITSFTLWQPVVSPQGVQFYRRAQLEQDVARALAPRNILHVD